MDSLEAGFAEEILYAAAGWDEAVAEVNRAAAAKNSPDAGRRRGLFRPGGSMNA